MSTAIPKANIFRFENAWLHNKLFLPSVLPAWHDAPALSDAAGHLAGCLKSTRAAAKVWARHHPSFPIANSLFYYLTPWRRIVHYLLMNYRCGPCAKIGFAWRSSSERLSGASAGSNEPSAKVIPTRSSSMHTRRNDSGATPSVALRSMV